MPDTPTAATSTPLVVVTGASQGIGEAVARAFAAAVPGVRLALLARTEATLTRVADACRALGADALALPTDVTDEAATEAAARTVAVNWGAAPDVLVANAGLFRPGPLLQTTLADFRAQIDTNLTSAFLTTRAFLPPMLDARRGLVVYTGSIASIRGYAGGGAYTAAKHGLLGLARVVREETKAHGVRVTTLLPGATRTPSWDGTAEPDDRFMPPEDVAAAVVGVWRLSPRTVVEEVLLRPQLGDL